MYAGGQATYHKARCIFILFLNPIHTWLDPSQVQSTLHLKAVGQALINISPTKDLAKIGRIFKAPQA